MKTIQDQIGKIIIKLNNKIKDRECGFDKRSEKWQESEAAEFYQDLTDRMITAIDELEMALDSINQCIDD